MDGALALIEMYPLVVLAVTVPVQLKPVLAANAGLAESAMANNGDGVEPDIKLCTVEINRSITRRNIDSI